LGVAEEGSEPRFLHLPEKLGGILPTGTDERLDACVV
jgi:hypothetical protein